MSKDVHERRCTIISWVLTFVAKVSWGRLDWIWMLSCFLSSIIGSILRMNIRLSSTTSRFCCSERLMNATTFFQSSMTSDSVLPRYCLEMTMNLRVSRGLTTPSLIIIILCGAKDNQSKPVTSN